MIPASRPRLAVLHLVVLAMLAALLVRVWYLQVRSGPAYAAQAAAERTRTVIEPPVRGSILDDTGAPIVGSRPALVISVNMPALWQQPGGGSAELRRLARLLHMSDTRMANSVRLCTATVGQPCWAGSPYQPIPVARHVPARLGLQVLEEQRLFPGVTAAVQPVTSYRQPIGTDLAQVLGYLQPITASEIRTERLPVTGFSGVDLVGQAGLERQYDPQLRGTPGQLRLAVNAAGQVTGTIGTVPPVAGDDLVTSISAQVQRDTENALAAAIRRSQTAGNPASEGGAAVVLTTTGRVVAMASYPTYNPAVWTGGITAAQFRRLFGTAAGEPILNRAAQGEYAPGSTWKITSVTAAVTAGYPLTASYDCPAAVTIGGRSYANDGNPSLGPMSLGEALVVSCDTVFYQLAYDIWLRDHRGANVVTAPRARAQQMQRSELGWGFGTDTGIDLPAESPGSVPTRQWLYYLWRDNAHAGQDWCRNGRVGGSYQQQIEYDDCHYGNVWTAGQSVIAAIGQGYVTVTPLQLARGYAALANGGTLYSPRIGEALLSPAGKVLRRITPPATGHLPASAATLRYIRTALAGVVTRGTAAGAFAGFPLGRVCIAGKTGTAQVAGTLATSVFASYAPCGHPRLVVVMMIPGTGYGADVSAPAVRQIWDAIFGLEGHRAALPGGELPRLSRSGRFAAGPAPARSRPAGGSRKRAA